MKLVDDPALLAQLDGSPAGKAISDPATLAKLDFDVDLNQPVDAVREQLGKLQGKDRDRALALWADHYVANERKQGGIGMAADNTVRTLARGSFVGPFLDEITAGSQALQHAAGLGGAPYDEALAYQRARDRAVDKNYPVASVAGQFAGGIAGGIGAMRQGASTIGKVLAGGPLATVAPSSTLPRAMAQGGGVGAVYGATAGFGNAEGGFDDRVEGAKTGAAYGTAAGAVLPPVLAGAGRALSSGADAISPTIARYGTDLANFRNRAMGGRGPVSLSAAADGAPSGPMISGAEAAADQVIANQLSRGGVGVDEIRQRLSQADRDTLFNAGNSRAQNVMGLIDVDPSLQRLGGSAARQQPEAGTLAKDFVAARQTGITPTGRPPGTMGLNTREALAKASPKDPPMGQFERVTDALRRAFRLKDNESHGHELSAKATDEQLIARARNESRPLYTESYKDAENLDLTPTLKPILDNWRAGLIDEPVPVAGQIKKAMDYVERSMSPAGKRSHLERFDKVKQWMDGRIEGAMKNDDRYLASRMIEFKNQMLAAIDNGDHPAFVKYKQARQAFSSPMQAREALNLGRESARSNSEIGAEHFAGLASESDRKLFRLGLYGDVVRQMKEKKRTADITQLFDTPRMQELLEASIPRSGGKNDVFYDRPERFGRFLRNERTMAQDTRNKVIGGSPTAERLADDAAFNTMTGIEKTLNDIRNSAGPIALSIKVVERALDKVFGFRQDTAAFVAHKLFTADPVAIQRTLAQVEKRLGRDRMDQFRRLLDEYQGLVVRTGSIAGTTTQPQQSR